MKQESIPAGRFTIGSLTVETREADAQRVRIHWEGIFMGREPEGLTEYLDAVSRTPTGEPIAQLEFDLQNFERLSSGMMGWLVRTIFKMREGRSLVRLDCAKRTSFQKVLFEILQEVVEESKEAAGGQVELRCLQH